MFSNSTTRAAADEATEYFNCSYLDGVRPGPVPGSHVPVAGGDGGGHGQVAVLAVHVVGAGAGVIPGDKQRTSTPTPNGTLNCLNVRT